jgi:peptidoglycan/LPS O-acetylase OafA/YrhL
VVVDPENMYWLARAFPPCRMPVFVMGCLAGRYLIIYNKDRDEDRTSKFMCPAPVTWGPVKTGDLAYFIYLAAIPFGGTQVFNGIRERDALRILMRLAVELLLPMLYFDWAISLCTHESWTRRLLSSRPMRWLGDISMSFYQVHMIVFELLVLGIGSAPVWIIAVSLVTSLFIGWLTYRYVEKPAQRLVLKHCLPKRTPKVVNPTAQGTGHSAPDNAGGAQPGVTVADNTES